MKITMTEATRLMDAMAMMYVSARFAFTNEIPDVEEVEGVVRITFTNFCEGQGIDEVEDDEDECPDFPDDVDESNYDPYMGCDFFESCDFDEGW